MVRYPFDLLRAVSEVEPLTTNGKSNTYALNDTFALRYRRVNWTFYEVIKILYQKYGHFLRKKHLGGSK
jgi:hypothetical protein